MDFCHAHVAFHVQWSKKNRLRFWHFESSDWLRSFCTLVHNSSIVPLLSINMVVKWALCVQIEWRKIKRVILAFVIIAVGVCIYIRWCFCLHSHGVSNSRHIGLYTNVLRRLTFCLNLPYNCRTWYSHRRYVSDFNGDTCISIVYQLFQLCK